ncbi:MAG: SDR family oxidoreductase, partial [Actinobacteria bacterium]|nr:SDR family oxidoreductase [Actinomycetota bacterium]
GLIDTPLASDAVAAVRADNAPINMVGRVGEPDEIAGLVHYLVSPLGRFANGTSYRVDGGALGLGPFDVR